MKTILVLAVLVFVVGCHQILIPPPPIVGVDTYYDGPYYVSGVPYWYFDGGFYIFVGGCYRFHHRVDRHYYDGHWREGHDRWRRIPRHEEPRHVPTPKPKPKPIPPKAPRR